MDDVCFIHRLFNDYMQSGKAGSDLTQRIDNAVVDARKREEWKSEYMKERALLMDIREEVREEDRIILKESVNALIKQMNAPLKLKHS